MIVQTPNDMSYVRHNFIPVKNKLLEKFSNAEERFEKLLQLSGLYYVREKGNFRYDTRWCYYDFFLPYYRIYIEIDGASHNNVAQQKIDKEKEDIIKHKKRFIVRLKNEEVLVLQEISLRYLISKLCVQLSQKIEWGFNFSVSDYLSNLITNINQAIEDMQEDSGILVDQGKKVFVFNKTANRIFVFKNACVAKMNMQVSIGQIMNLLEKTDYTHRSSLRKYILAYSLEDCIQKTISTTGRDDFAIGEESDLYPTKELLPIMTDAEQLYWWNVPQKKRKEAIDSLKELGFVRSENKRFAYEMFSNKEYPFYFKKRYWGLNIAIYAYNYHVKVLWVVDKKSYIKSYSCRKFASMPIERIITAAVLSTSTQHGINICEIANQIVNHKQTK